MQATMNFKLDPTLKTAFLYPTQNAETLQAMKDLLLGENTIKTTAEEFFEWAESCNIED